MARFVSLPEETLAQLLKEAGRKETIQEFLETGENKKHLELAMRFQKRANVAYWSQYWLLASAVVTWIFVVLAPDLEGIFWGLLLTAMTWVEHKVYLWFKAGDDRAISWGWWNQCLFAFLFFVYGIYHGTWDPISSDDKSVIGFVGTDALESISDLARVIYYAIGLVAGGGQFTIACYYALTKRNLS